MKGNRALRIFDSITKWASSITGIIGAIFIFLMTLLITVDVIGRAMGHPTYIATEVSGYMLVGIVYLGLAYTQRKGKHIKIIMLVERFPQKIQHALGIVALIIALAFIIWVTWLTLGPVIQNYSLGATSITQISTPLWIPYGFITLGFAVLGIELITELVKAITSQKN